MRSGSVAVVEALFGKITWRECVRSQDGIYMQFNKFHTRRRWAHTTCSTIADGAVGIVCPGGDRKRMVCVVLSVLCILCYLSRNTGRDAPGG